MYVCMYVCMYDDLMINCLMQNMNKNDLYNGWMKPLKSIVIIPIIKLMANHNIIHDVYATNYQVMPQIVYIS